MRTIFFDDDCWMSCVDVGDVYYDDCDDGDDVGVAASVSDVAAAAVVPDVLCTAEKRPADRSRCERW